MAHNPKRKIELITSVFTAAFLGLAVLVTQTDVISAQSSNFQGGQPEVSQTPDMRNVRILFPAGVRSSWPQRAPLGKHFTYTSVSPNSSKSVFLQA